MPSRKETILTISKLLEIDWGTLDDWELEFIYRMADAITDINWIPEERQWDKMQEILKKK